MSHKHKKKQQQERTSQPMTPTPSALFPVDAEIRRPLDGQRQFQISVGCLQLPAEVLNIIYDAAAAATRGQPGEILSITLTVKHPDADSIQADARQQAQQVNAPRLVAPEEPPEDDTWEWPEVDEVDEVDDEAATLPIDAFDALTLLLKQTEGAPKGEEDRLSLAFDIYELAMQSDVDEETTAIWDWFTTYLLGIYQRLAQSSRAPRDPKQRLNLAANIVGVAEEHDIDSANSKAVWEWFQMECSLETDKRTNEPVLVVHERRVPQRSPAA